MPNEDIEARLALIQKPNWTLQEIEKTYGISLIGNGFQVLQNFRMATEESYDVAFENPPDTINRLRFEVFLQSRGWISKRSAALAWGMTGGSFDQIQRVAVTRGLLAPSEGSLFNGQIFLSDFISNFFKRFPDLRERIFPTLSVFYDRFHDEIRNRLGFSPVKVFCETSRILGEQGYGTSLDILSLVPMSPRVSVFLNTSKPPELRPDTCSWLTYVANTELLGPFLLGNAPQITQDQFTVLRSHVSA